ncbi:hypothetical protein TWF970_010520 [Orbilia oligospora]|uniref:G domain-containing protein n=1 Tax=Orbilia oligospora TaxID=2813651 RepID=A0A7C8RGM0_ORBOL|nr:hypothetical protein TWF970_010520 [Orbilia oligospora]
MASIDLQLNLMSNGKECPKRYILVTGVTGAGKSTFIANAMSPQDPTPQIGHGLKSSKSSTHDLQGDASQLSSYSIFTYINNPLKKHYIRISKETSRIQEFPIGESLDGYDVTLVDMPGFDDTYIDSVTILEQVINWLDELCKAKKQLSGIIHLHRISDNRVPGSGAHAIKLLKSIIGEAGIKNIMLVTNMWRGGEEEEGIRVEEELKNDKDFWAPLLDKKAKTGQYGFYTSKSLESEALTRKEARKAARCIITEVLKNNVEITQFERETVGEDKTYGETAICLTVGSHLIDWGNAVDKKVTKADKVADECKETDPERSARFREMANEARREKEKIRREWALLATFLNGLGYLIGALAEKFGSKLMHDGVLCTFKALVQYVEGIGLDIESHPGLYT